MLRLCSGFERHFVRGLATSCYDVGWGVLRRRSSHTSMLRPCYDHVTASTTRATEVWASGTPCEYCPKVVPVEVYILGHSWVYVTPLQSFVQWTTPTETWQAFSWLLLAFCCCTCSWSAPVKHPLDEDVVVELCGPANGFSDGNCMATTKISYGNSTGRITVASRPTSV